jgi:hypothetical protein
MRTTYKLTRLELLQALADYLTKKYGISDRHEAGMSAQIDPITGGVIVDVKPWEETDVQ